MFYRFSILVLLCLLFTAPISADFDEPHAVYLPIVSQAPPGDMVYVPAGTFMFGCDPESYNGIGCGTYSYPLQEMYLDSFYIDKYEVTNAQYMECVGAGACLYAYSSDPFFPPARQNDPVYANYPVVQEINGVYSYCNWKGKRKPTEFEWEKAARGPQDSRPYPWGWEPPTCALTNFNNCIGDTVPVGSYPWGASPYGAMDMAGNIREWTSSGYCGTTGGCSALIAVRGGSWGDDDIAVNVAARRAGGIWPGNYTVGFRCVYP